MKREKRHQYYVDRAVQGLLLARAALYWAFCIVMLTLVLLCWRVLTGPSRPLHVHLDHLWFHYQPVFLATAMILPVVMLDVLRLSNRFAGPMLRIRFAMKRLADGDPNVGPLYFRKNDFWHDFSDSFNRLLERLQEDGEEKPERTTASSPSRSESTAAAKSGEEEKALVTAGDLA
jgi:hypothetical protein